MPFAWSAKSRKFEINSKRYLRWMMWLSNLHHEGIHHPPIFPSFRCREIRGQRETLNLKNIPTKSWLTAFLHVRKTVFHGVLLKWIFIEFYEYLWRMHEINSKVPTRSGRQSTMKIPREMRKNQKNMENWWMYEESHGDQFHHWIDFRNQFASSMLT